VGRTALAPAARYGAAARGAGPVPRRVAALLAPCPGPLPGPSALVLAAAVLLVAISGAAALDAARDLHQLIELAQARPR
jgi:hypothetical protein